MALTTPARTLVGSAAIAIDAGPAHHGAFENLSVASHAHARTQMEVRDTRVPHARAMRDSGNEEEEGQATNPECSVEDC